MLTTPKAYVIYFSRSRKTLIGCLLFYILFIMMLGPCDAASIFPTLLPDGTWKVTIEGEILNGDSNKLEYVVNVMQNSERAFISSIHLNSPGGLVDEGLAIAKLIRKRKFMTIVERGHHCESICFFMLMYGDKKIISREARIGIHGASRGGKDARDVTWQLYEKEMQFFIPEYLGRGINGIPAREMYYLTIDDFVAMGFDCSERICKSDILN